MRIIQCRLYEIRAKLCYVSKKRNEEKRKALRKVWQEYAKQVYINSACIVDANTNTEKKDTIKNFLLAMNETEKKNK